MKKLNNAIVLPLIGAMMCGAFACVPAQEVSDAATKSYTDLANTATLGSSLRIEPSVVYEVKSKGDLGAIESADVAPSVALLEVSAGMNVKFTDGNIDRIDECANKIFLRANADGKPEYVPQTINGITYKAVKVADKIYIPDRTQTV